MTNNNDQADNKCVGLSTTVLAVEDDKNKPTKSNKSNLSHKQQTNTITLAKSVYNNNKAEAFLSKGAQVIIRMRGLPFNCTHKQVVDFFASTITSSSFEQKNFQRKQQQQMNNNNSRSSRKLSPTILKSSQVFAGEEGVLFVKNQDDKPTGDAFVLFANEEDAQRGLAKHHENIGQRYVELFRSSISEVQQVLSISSMSDTQLSVGRVAIDQAQRLAAVSNLATSASRQGSSTTQSPSSSSSNSIKQSPRMRRDSPNTSNTNPTSNNQRKAAISKAANSQHATYAQVALSAESAKIKPPEIEPESRPVPPTGQTDQLNDRPDSSRPSQPENESSNEEDKTIEHNPSAQSKEADDRLVESREQQVSSSSLSPSLARTNQTKSPTSAVNSGQNNYSSAASVSSAASSSSYARSPAYLPRKHHSQHHHNQHRTSSSGAGSNNLNSSSQFVNKQTPSHYHPHHYHHHQQQQQQQQQQHSYYQSNRHMHQHMIPASHYATAGPDLSTHYHQQAYSMLPHQNAALAHYQPYQHYYQQMASPASAYTHPNYAPPPPVAAQSAAVELSGSERDCLRLRGLPFEAQVEHVLEFLGPKHSENILLHGVHLVYSSQGQLTGEAIVQMSSASHAEAAAHEVHKRVMQMGKKQRYIEVIASSLDELKASLGYGLSAAIAASRQAAAFHAYPPAPAYYTLEDVPVVQVTEQASSWVEAPASPNVTGDSGGGGGGGSVASPISSPEVTSGGEQSSSESTKSEATDSSEKPHIEKDHLDTASAEASVSEATSSASAAEQAHATAPVTPTAAPYYYHPAAFMYYYPPPAAASQQVAACNGPSSSHVPTLALSQQQPHQVVSGAAGANHLYN